ncbi:mannosyl-oligosaccharide alpha-1,2-mannosidase [Coemansia sp. RSA 990]|nr:mannosyl-oligosaccharide alpha-1,2-mannosidase [Coemansia sp. RSA 1086]KAJ1751925.1 mannosyl-oligosaccharide alpha-1,2-mannosidase [Coemansia sp. RSA 1821]KAJ1872091.1 mannosyl-oligosaccharide alpha-1,2-mannosidase [Coemansia sp. RSA 990]KAJ2670333.1 mannosyl-oligosaccharide alpha-1,2-mannosidase [Coemansia sp. RSA 1085]
MPKLPFRWRKLVLVPIVLVVLYLFKRKTIPAHKEEPEYRRYRTLEQHPRMQGWTTNMTVNWQPTHSQLAQLDAVVQLAKCGSSCRPPTAVNWTYRQQQVVAAAKSAWNAYTRDAFGYDEHYPLSRYGKNFTHLGIGYIVADSLDTLLLMGLSEEYKRGRDFLVNQVTFDQRGAVSLFESTIRILGGLLSAFHWSGETDYRLLALADQLGERLARSFNTSTGIPPETAILRSDGMPFATECSTSESSTLQLEFRYLSKLTGKPEYRQQVDRIIDAMLKAPKYDGLVPTWVSSRYGNFTGSDISLGSRGDSYYEYLLKQWLQTRQSEVDLRAEYDSAMRGVKKYLVEISPYQDLTYIGELRSVTGSEPWFSAKMDHLVCFLAGNLALGATNGTALADIPAMLLSVRDREDLVLARELGETCARMYFDTPSGLAPEIAYFRQVDRNTKQQVHFEAADQLVPPNGDILVPPSDRHYLLRPETVESFYLLWKITGETKWREYGWQIFQAIEKWAKLEDGGYSSLNDVTQIPPTRRDGIESFFVAETLKYLYLLFSDSDPVSLTNYVFNTEAHPLPKFSWVA